MIRLSKSIVFALSLLLLPIAFGVERQEEDGQDAFVSFKDAAVVFAKYSGWFDRYIASDADLGECVAFLNKTGIYFGMLEVATGAEFTVQDCARTMGQAELVFSGDADFVGGKVKLPEQMASWMEYCNLNDIEYVRAFGTMKEMLRVADQKNR